MLQDRGEIEVKGKGSLRTAEHDLLVHSCAYFICKDAFPSWLQRHGAVSELDAVVAQGAGLQFAVILQRADVWKVLCKLFSSSDTSRTL